jgi:ABC-2 type transport system permease protein
MAVFFLFFTVHFGVTSLLEERNDGMLARLLAAPVSRVSILGAKLLTSLRLGTVSMTVLAVATTLLFRAHWGNPLGVAVLVVSATRHHPAGHDHCSVCPELTDAAPPSAGRARR